MKNALPALIFDSPLEGKLAAINTVIEEAHCWTFDDRLIACVSVPDAGVDTGMGLYNALRAQKVEWDELECAAPAEFHQALAVPPGHNLLVYDAAVGCNPRCTLSK